MVIAMLGVLKAGGAYVPLDPQSPRDRVRFMLDDAGVCAVVTTLALRGTIPRRCAGDRVSRRRGG